MLMGLFRDHNPELIIFSASVIFKCDNLPALHLPEADTGDLRSGTSLCAHLLIVIEQGYPFPRGLVQAANQTVYPKVL